MGFDLDDGFRIGGWEANPRQLTLIRGEVRHRLEPKVMAVLVCMAEHPGDVVTRDEFAEAVWMDRVVSDEVLSRNISMLRSHLGDDAREPVFIQTIPRRGYRLIVPVEPLTGGVNSRKEISRRMWMVLASALAGVLVVGLWFAGETELLDPTTIAVLPFENLSGTDDDYFSDGLTEEILGALSNVEGLKVIPRTTSFAMRGSGNDVRTIGKLLSAGSILGGSVRWEGEQLKVTARLVDANEDLQLWSDIYDKRTMADIFAIQEDISAAIVEKLVGTLQPGATVTSAPTNDLVAYNLFLRARHQLRRRGQASLQLSIDLFRQAIERDPEFGRAHVGLAEAYTNLPDYAGEEEEPMLDLAIAVLQRASELGADQSRVQGLLGHIYRKREEWLEAERQFSLALASSPDDPDIHHWRGLLLSQLGYVGEALAAAQRAVVLDPLSPVLNQRLAILSSGVGDVEGAAKYFAIAGQLGLGEDAIPEAYIPVLLRQGDLAGAAATLKTMQADRGKASEWVQPFIDGIQGTTDTETALAAVERAQEQGLLSQTSYIGALFFLGASDQLLDALLDYERRGEPVVAFELVFAEAGKDVRRHPRFPELVDRLGFVEYWQAHGWPPACRWDGTAAVCQ